MFQVPDIAQYYITSWDKMKIVPFFILNKEKIDFQDDKVYFEIFILCFYYYFNGLVNVGLVRWLVGYLID